MTKDERHQLTQYMIDMKFMPGGRYLYYAGRDIKYFNNCYLLKAEEDSREDWADLSWKAESCLLTGGGIGCDYSVYRAEGTNIKRTGGVASGPIPKMRMVDNLGRGCMQGGARRAAIYVSLNWQHADVPQFLVAKDWHNMPIGKTGQTYWDVKQDDFNFPAPLDHTNISVNYDTEWLLGFLNTGEPGEIFEVEFITVTLQAPFHKVFYFTFDGSCPTKQSARYNRPFMLPQALSPITLCILVFDIKDLTEEIYCVNYGLFDSSSSSSSQSSSSESSASSSDSSSSSLSSSSSNSSSSSSDSSSSAMSSSESSRSSVSSSHSSSDSSVSSSSSHSSSSSSSQGMWSSSSNSSSLSSSSSNSSSSSSAQNFFVYDPCFCPSSNSSSSSSSS